MSQEQSNFLQSFPRLIFFLKCLAMAAGISATLLILLALLFPASDFATRIIVVGGFSLVVIIGCTVLVVMIVAELRWSVKQRGLRKPEM